MPLLPKSHALRRGISSVVGEYPAPQSLHHLLPPPPPRSSSAPSLGDARLLQNYAQMARGLLSSSSPTCSSLGPGDIKIVGEHPVAAGGFADVWEGTYDGRKVVLKSYRCYVLFDVVNVVAVRYNYARTEYMANGSLAEVSQRSSRVDPPAPTRCGRSTARRGVLD